MSIFNHFQHINLTNDQRNALEKISIFLENDAHIFMLKGYAGSGKTTLIKGIVDFLQKNKKQCQLMAPTGRAAKILREKTGSGSTIHKGIYEFQKYDFKGDKKDDFQEDDYKLIFPIKDIEKESQVLLIDEASMVSNTNSNHPLFQFGTGCLMDDLLTYSKIPILNNKIIFIGDPAQLPPVGDNESKAFIINFFEEKGLLVEEVELTEVKRQSDGLILKNATQLRNKIKEDNPTTLHFEYDQNSFIKLNSIDIVNQYIKDNPIPELSSGVVISFSNKQCFHQNKAIREIYFPNQDTIQSGDIIQITSNSYNFYAADIYNGDFAKVISVQPKTISITAPVYTSIAGEKTKQNITLEFRKITIKLDSYHEPFECMVIDSLLNSFKRDLTVEEHKAIYINFIMRFEEMQKIRKKEGLPVIKKYSKEFYDILKSDPHINAIHCKYGYAITCHKSQGGEWKKTIVDYSGRVSLKKEPLRWAYTTTTRATDTCYAVNAPNFNVFSKFEISSISQITKIPKEAYNYGDIPETPWHSKDSNPGKRAKYWDIYEKLENTDIKIEKVLSKDYLERYFLSDGENRIILDGYHNEAGLFLKGFSLTTEKTEKTQVLEELFNAEIQTFNTIPYVPSQDFLSELYSSIQDACIALDIVITNIDEKVNQHFVNYFFRTDSICSLIQFYFNKNGHFTKALPRTYNCSQDHKLSLLIKHITNYVI